MSATTPRPRGGAILDTVPVIPCTKSVTYAVETVGRFWANAYHSRVVRPIDLLMALVDPSQTAHAAQNWDVHNLLNSFEVDRHRLLHEARRTLPAGLGHQAIYIEISPEVRGAVACAGRVARVVYHGSVANTVHLLAALLNEGTRDSLPVEEFRRRDLTPMEIDRFLRGYQSIEE